MKINDIINTTNLIIYEAATITIDSNWKYYDLKSPFNRLYYIIDGSCYIIYNNKKIHLKSGFMYLMTADSMYTYICNNYAKKHYVHFNLQSSLGFDILSMDRKPIRHKISDNKINQLIKYSKINSYMASMKYKGMVSECISEFLVGQDKRIQHKLEKYIGYEEILKYIHDNLSFELRTIDIAKRFSISTSTLDRKFNNLFSASVKKYIEKLLIDKAVKFILTDNKPIKEIAFQLGFNDPLYFTKFFKRNTGYSPKKYRSNKI